MQIRGDFGMVEESRLVIAIDARNAEKTANALNKELQNLTAYGDRADKQVGVLGTSVRSLAGYMAGLVTVSTAVAKMDAYSNLQNRLRLVTTSQQELNKATEDTYKIALKTYQSWDSVVQVYQRFSDNAKTLNIDMAKTAQLTETVSKAVAISGASTQAAEAALTQFGQSLASGVFRGEEFNSVAEQTPALLKAIANGLGVNIGQLREMAQSGEITSDVLVKALGNAAADVDNKFSKMQMTIGQSLTNLDTQVTKFAENTTGAASTIANSIALIANNLEIITGGAMVVGIGYLTTAIATKTTAITADVTALLAQRTATIAQTAEDLKMAQATVASTAAEVAGIEAKIASLTATRALLIEEAKAELQRKKTQISTQGAINSELRLGLIRNQMKTATAEIAVAETALSTARAKSAAAQTAATAASAGAATAGRALLGVLGGPVGIGITVASLAAGYLMMRDSTAEATDKLNAQADIANKTREELLKLQGVQREGAKSDLAEAFNAQNKALKESNFLFNSRVIAIQNANKGNTEIVNISNKVRQGLMSQTDALKELNKIKYVTPDQLKQLQDAANQYEENRTKAQKTADAQAVFGTKSTLAGNAAQNAAGKVDSNSSSLDKNADAANNAAEAQSKYLNQLRKSNVEVMMTNKLIDQGWTPERAKATARAYSETGKVTKETIQLIDQNIAANNKLKATEDAIANSKKSSSSASNSAASQAKRDAQEQLRLAQELADMRYQIAYQYSNREVQLQEDLEQRKADIKKAYASDPTEMKKYLDWAQIRFDAEKKLYDATLGFELNAYKLNEQEKLTVQKNIEIMRVKASGEMTAEEKKSRIESIKGVYEEELAQIKLTQKQRLLSANEALMSEEQRIIERYKLEREEIAKTKDAEERKALLSAKDRTFVSGGVNPIDGEYFKNSPYKEMFKTNVQVLQEGYIKEAELMAQRHQEAREQAILNNEDFLEIDKAYFESRAQMQAEYDKKFSFAKQNDWMSSFQKTAGIVGDVSNSWGRLTEAVRQTSGEQSKEYRKMFEVQKKFAMISAVVNGALAVSQVWADPSLNFYMKIGASIATGIATAAEVALISSQQPQGFKTGGYTGNAGTSQVAGVVHGQEYVLNAEATKRVGVGTLDAINSGGNLPQQAQTVSGGDVNLKMINVVDPKMVGDFMNTADGEKVMLNFIRNNKSEVARIVR